MIYLAIIAVAILGSALLSSFRYLKRRQRRQRSLELRLLAGQERLLEEEIELRHELLSEFDLKNLERNRQQAEEVLNRLQIAFVDRQARLLSCADLVHLQQLKLAVLNTRCAALGDLPSPEPSPEPSTSPPQNRTQLEEQLRASINQLRQDRPFKGP